VIGSLNFDPERRKRLEQACRLNSIRLLKFSFRLDSLTNAV
jgi:hypothetical protein